MKFSTTPLLILAALTTSAGATLRGSESEKQQQHQLQTRRLNKGKGQPETAPGLLKKYEPMEDFSFSATSALEVSLSEQQLVDVEPEIEVPKGLIMAPGLKTASESGNAADSAGVVGLFGEGWVSHVFYLFVSYLFNHIDTHILSSFLST